MQLISLTIAFQRIRLRSQNLEEFGFAIFEPMVVVRGALALGQEPSEVSLCK